MGGTVPPGEVERVIGPRALEKPQAVASNGIRKKKSSQQAKGTFPFLLCF